MHSSAFPFYTITVTYIIAASFAKGFCFMSRDLLDIFSDLL